MRTLRLPGGSTRPGPSCSDGSWSHSPCSGSRPWPSLRSCPDTWRQGYVAIGKVYKRVQSLNAPTCLWKISFTTARLQNFRSRSLIEVHLDHHIFYSNLM